MKKFIFSSLKTRLYLLVVISIIPVCALILYSAFEQRHSDLKKIEQHVLHLTEAAAAEEAQIIEGARQILIVLGNFLSSAKLDPTSCKTFFSDIRVHFTRYANLGAVYPDGTFMCSTDPIKKPFSVRNHEWFKQTLNSTDISAGKFSIDQINDIPVLIMSSPVYDVNHQMSAIVFAAIDISWLNRFTSHASIQVPDGSTLSQMDATGVLITYQPETRTWAQGSLSDEVFYKSILNQKKGTIESRDAQGGPVIYAFAPLKSDLKGQEIVLILTVPAEIAYANSNRRLFVNLILLATVFLMAMIMARYASRYFILGDIEKLIHAKKMFAEGNLSTRINTIHSGGELGQLANAFNEMASALEKHDIERKDAEERLKNSRETLRSLTEYIQTIREKERTRIAREIHDNLGQSLTALKMDLSWLDKRLETEQIHVRDKIRSMDNLIQDTIYTVQRVSAELRPGILDDFGLGAAIEWQAEEFQQRTQIQTKVSLPEGPLNISRDQATAIFRIFQEALTNVIRHADASAVEVILAQAEGRLNLTVKDNGRGISPDDISSPKSLGLIGMQERVYPWKGEVSFHGVPKQGTRVTISIPIAK